MSGTTDCPRLHPRCPRSNARIAVKICSLGVERVVRAMAVERLNLKTIAFEGPATIYEVSAHRETLREALAEGKGLRLDLGDSGKWDLAGLQLLISCVKTAQTPGPDGPTGQGSQSLCRHCRTFRTVGLARRRVRLNEVTQNDLVQCHAASSIGARTHVTL